MRALILILLLTPFFGFSQVKSIKINVNLEKIETSSRVNIGTIRLLKNEKEELKSTLQKGRFKHKLDTGCIYKVYLSKINHVTKFLLIDTRMLPYKTKKHQKLRVTMTYFLEPEQGDLSFLNETPVGVARYDEQYKKLRWDYEYAILINERIGKILYQL